MLNECASTTNRLARGASIYVVWLALGKGLTVLLQVVLGRWLGPALYGLYALGYSIISLLSWVSVLGLDQGVLRFCAIHRTRDQLGELRLTLWRALETAGVASVLTATGLLLGSDVIARRFFVPSFGNVLAGFAMALPFIAVARIAGTYLQSLQDINRMSFLQLFAGPSLNIALLMLAILWDKGLIGAVETYVSCCVGTAALAAYYLVKKRPAKLEGKMAAASDALPLIRYSLALMLTGLSYQLILRAPQVLLGHLGSSTDVGVYSAGASFALGFGFMTLTFLQPALPMLVELYETRQTEALRLLYQNSTRWTLALVTPIFLLLALFNSEVMQVFGRNFRAAGPILLVMSLGWLVYYGKGPGSALLQMTGRQNLDLANTLGVAILTVAMNYFAIPRYGAMGAAIATAGCTVVWAVVEYTEVRLLYGLWPWSSGALLNILGAFVTAGVVVFLRLFLPWETCLVTAICLYGMLYFGCCLEADDRRLMAAGLARVRGLLQC